MSLQFIIGGSGSGKTRRLYEDLIRESIECPKGRFFAIVPEQFTMQTQKDIVTLHPDHGTMNIDIVSFERLAYRIFEELSVERLDVLDDMGKSMILRKVAAAKKKELKLFGGHLDKAGFIGELKSMLSEFLQYGITREALNGMADRAGSAMLKQKLSDMLVLYEGFKEFTEGKLAAKEEILAILCRVLPQSGLIRGSVVTLDGYTGFTPVQYQLLELLLTYCRKVVVTITMDPEENPYLESGMQHLFHLSKHTVCRLTDLAAGTGTGRLTDICINSRNAWRFKSSPALGFIEKELFRYRRNTYTEDAADQLVLIHAAAPRQEIACISGEIERLIKEEGFCYRDIAVVTGALEDYSREIVRQFAENEIPCFIDDKKNIMGNPMVELLRAVLELLQKDFSYESVFRYLKTGLAVSEAGKREEADRLENYVLALGIRGFKRWDVPWDRVYRGAELLNLEELNAFKEEILSPIRPLRTVMRNRKATVRERTEGLVKFLTELKAEEQLKEYEDRFHQMGEASLEKEYSQIFGLVMDLFDRVTALLGTETVSGKEYAEILDAGFSEIKVGLIPAVVDRVVVGDIKRTRLSHIKVLFFAGINDGIIPAVSGRGGILSETERKRLKEQRVELAPTVKEEGFLQRLYLYLVLTKPSDRLYLSYSSMSGGGKSLRPSSLITQLEKLFPSLRVLEGKEMEARLAGWSVPQGKRRLIAGLKGDERMWEDRQFLELYRFFYGSEKDRGEVKRLVEAAFYSYKERGISRTAAREIYGAILRGSVTRMEQFASCACAHFLAYGLELSERPVYTLAPSDIGNLFHRSIDLFFKTMQEEKRSFRELTQEDRKELVKACVSRVTKEYGNTIMDSSARNRYLAGKVERITDRTIWALTEQLKKGDFEPAGFEVSFTPEDHLKAMQIPLSEDEAIYLRGRIDRIDVCEDGDLLYLKVIDYKTGRTKFDLSELYFGLQLQLVVYLDAAMEKVQRDRPDKTVVPAGIFYYNIDDPMVDRKPEEMDGDLNQAILKKLRMNGLVHSRLDAIRHLDRLIETESDVIPVALKSGLIQEAKSSVAGEKRFQALSSYVNQKLTRMGRSILDGTVSVNPYKKGDQTACDYCPYRSVCGFDLKTEGYGYRRFKKLKPEEIWEEIEGAKAEEGRTEEGKTEQTDRKRIEKAGGGQAHGSELD